MQWAIPAFLDLLVYGQLPAEVTAEYPAAVTPKDFLPVINMLITERANNACFYTSDVRKS